MNFTQKGFSYSTNDVPYEINQDGLIQARTLLDDYIFKLENKTDPDSLAIFKIMGARENNYDFELDLAKRICGNADDAPYKYYPYRSASEIQKLFEYSNLRYYPQGSRVPSVEYTLKRMNTKDICLLIKNIFLEKTFKDHTNKLGEDFDEYYTFAKDDLKKFIDEGIHANRTINLVSLLDININSDLLNNIAPSTLDEVLNQLINEARERFWQIGDKHIALEKLWDAFERVKTYFALNKSEKKDSANKLIGQISNDFDKEFIEQEFDQLTTIGNKYRIRHHETYILDIKDDKHINYLFFRMLSLISLCLTGLNQNN